MGLVDRLNGWALGRLRSRRGAIAIDAVDAAGFVLGGARVAWRDIDEVAATLGAGDTMVLVVGLRDGRVVTLSAADAGFAPLADTLHLHLPGAARHARWSLEAAAAPGTRAHVFRR